MLWILLVVGVGGAVIFFPMFIVDSLCKFRDRKEILNHGIKTVIFIALGTVGFLGLCGMDCLSYDEVLQTGNWELVSFTDDCQISSKVSVELFYIHDSIYTEQVYSFYYQVNDDGFKRGKVDADITTIYEKDDCTPHVVEYTTYTKNKMNIILQIILTFGYRESSQKTYEIYTPTGTILRTFNLDSQ